MKKKAQDNVPENTPETASEQEVVQETQEVQKEQKEQEPTEEEKLQKQIAALENKIRKEKQFNRQVEMNAELKRLKKDLEQLTKEDL